MKVRLRNPVVLGEVTLLPGTIVDDRHLAEEDMRNLVAAGLASEVKPVRRRRKKETAAKG